MAVPQKRYADAREAYFSTRPPPIPPKQDRRKSAQDERRYSNPGSSPQHQKAAVHDYTEFSNSIPRNRSKAFKKKGTPGTNGSPGDTGQRRNGEKPPPTNLQRANTFSGSGDVNGVLGNQEGETPPAIPPRPVVISSIQTMFKKERPKFLTDEMSLQDLITHHHKSFPVRMYVTNGYLGATSRLTISTGDTYNVHFVKHTKVMLLRDNHDTPYSIPLNSAIEFGLLYEPKEGRKPTDIEEGMVFKGVADILAQQEIPKVVGVLKSWRGDDNKSTFLTNEVLIIRSAQRSMFKVKKGLKAYSVTTKSDKFLPEDCMAKFTTEPSYCRLHISDIVEHVKHPKGCHCILFFNSKVLLNREMSSPMQDISQGLFQKVLTILDQVTETSIISSSLLRRENVSEEEYDPDRDVLFDIPVDENTALISVALVEINDTKETEKLYDDTKSLYEKFDPSRVLSVKDTGSENAYMEQKLLYTTIRHGCEGLGVELDRPEAVYDNVRLRKVLKTAMPPTPPSSASSSPALSKSGLGQSHLVTPSVAAARGRAATEESDDSLEYDEVNQEALEQMRQPLPPRHPMTANGAVQPLGQVPPPPSQPALSQPPPSLPPQQTLPLPPPPQQQPQSSLLEARIASLESQMAVLGKAMQRQATMEQEMTRMKSTIEKLLPQIYALHSKLQQITSSPQRQGAVTRNEGSPPIAEGAHVRGEEEEKAWMEKNRKFLKTVNSQQIGQLLDAMELGHYKDAFARECVSGEILLECDDDILREDLGVASRLHRLRLAKVIDGRHSAASILEGADPYVSLGAP